MLRITIYIEPIETTYIHHLKLLSPPTTIFTDDETDDEKDDGSDDSNSYNDTNGHFITIVSLKQKQI